MALATYSDLQSSIADWLHRTDLTSVIPDFIRMAEENLSADISSRSMDTVVNLSLTAGVDTVALPSDMVEMRRLQVLGNFNTVLKYVTPDQLSSDYANNYTGTPQVFTVIGENIEVAPIPDAAYTLELTYKQRIPALSNTNTANWLLTSWPSCYLYGSLLAAQSYMIGDDRLPTIKALYQEAVNNINAVDYYSGSTMRVKVR